MISDEEFDSLIDAYKRGGCATSVTTALCEAADTALRKTILRAIGIEATKREEMVPTVHKEKGDGEKNGSSSADRSNVIPLSTHVSSMNNQKYSITLSDVGGLGHVKKQLRRVLLEPLKNPGLFQKFKRRTGGGLLLYGPPGCGKTMVVRAVAEEARLHLVMVEAAEILDCSVGVSEKKLSAAFIEARRMKPSILFFDEVEALAGRRSTGTDFKAGLVSSFLTAFDGLADQNEGVLVIGATNTPWAVDTAFRRPGRFDKTLFVPPPDREAREEILHSLLSSRPLSGSVNISAVADQTSGFSGADLMHLVETAIDSAIEDCLATGASEMIDSKHFESALAEVNPTTEEWLATAYHYAKYSSNGNTYKEVLTFFRDHAA